MTIKHSDEDVAVSVNGVYKNFKLPHEKTNSLKAIITGITKNKVKTFEIQHALKDISFEVKKGDFFGIVGRNGSGKSTLLKIIAGIYQTNKGEVVVNGRLVPFIELGVGFNPELTGRENVYMNGALMGFSEKEVSSKLKDIVAFAELERFMDQKLKNYSSGMQVRLAFSVATVLAESDILLIDEVLAVGDADFQRKCFEYFKKLKRAKKTVIFVSHDMNAIREYCDKAILIDESKIVFSGTSDETAKEYMRLFLPDQYKVHEHESYKKQTQDEVGRWGRGGSSIDAISFVKSTLTQDDDSVDIIVDVTAKEDYPEGIIFGITVKNQQGEGVCGTNNRIIRQETKEPVKKNSKLRLIWSIPNIFNEGTYVVEPAISDPVNMDIIAWWDDAGEFFVENQEKTPYKVAPKIRLEIAKS